MKNLRNSLLSKSIFLLAVALVFALPSKAAPILSYDASAASKDPTDQGWTHSGTNSSALTAGQETIGSTTYDYWDVSNPSPASTTFSAAYRGNLQASDYTDPQGWTATVSARIQLATDTINGAWFQVSDGVSSWEISFVTVGGTSINYIDNAKDNVSLSTHDITADYFTMQMYYDPTGSTVSYFLNGSQVGSAVSRSGVPTSIASRLYMRWGDNSASPARTEQHWNSVKFEAGNTVIPEPTTGALVLVSGLGILAFGRHRRQTASV